MAIKRIISMLLLLVIVLSQIPMQVSANTKAVGEVEPVYSDNGYVDENGELLYGGIRISKTAEKTGEPNEYEITVEVESKPSVNTQEASILFLVDISEEEVLQKNKEYLKQVIPKVAQKNPENKIALLTVSDTVKTVVEFTNAEGLDELLSAADNLAVSSGNYLEEGIRSSRALLEQQSSENKLMVVVSKGYASYSTKVSEVSASVYCEDHGVTQPIWEITAEYDSPMTLLGTGNHMSRQLYGNRVIVPKTNCNAGVQHTPDDEEFPMYHSDTAISEAILAKQNDIDIISVKLVEPASQSLFLMETIQNKGLFRTTEDAEAGVLDCFITSEISAFEIANINQVFNENVILDTQSITSTSGETGINENTLSWELKESSGTLKYKVKLDVESPSFDALAETDVCSTATFEYDNAESFAISQPKIKGEYSKVFLQAVLVDKQGNYIDENGEKADTPEHAIKLTSRLGYNNSRGVNQWAPGSQIRVSSQGLDVPQKHILHPSANPECTFTLIDQAAEPTIYFPYINIDASYVVEHYIDGASEPFDTQMVEAELGETISSATDSESTPLGYIRDRAEGLPLLIEEDGSIIRLYYKINELETIPYTIKYYKDGIMEEKEENSIPLANPRVEVRPDKDKYESYSFDKIKFYETEHTEEITTDITLEKNIFHIYYIKDIPSEIETLSYTINYYLNDVFQSSYSVLVEKDNPIVDFVVEQNIFEDAFFDYFSFAGNIYESNQDITISEQNNVIDVHYHRVETIPYTIEIYLDGVLSVRTDDNKASKTNPVQIFEPEYRRGNYTLKKVSFGGEGEHSQENTSEVEVSGTITETDYVFRAYYEIEIIKCLVQYYYDDEHFTIKDHNVSIEAGKEFTQSKIIDEQFGYNKADEYTVPAIPIVITEPTNIKVYYESDDNTRIPYTIEYYQNENLSFKEEKNVYAKNSFVQLDIDELSNLYTENGYALKSVFFMSLEQSSGEISLWQNSFKVLYEKIEEEKEYIDYTVEHYYEEILELTENLKADKDYAVVDSVEFIDNKDYVAYKIEPSLPHVISDGDDIIRVYYKHIEEEIPIDPDHNPDEQMDITLIFDDPAGEIGRVVSVPINQEVKPWVIFDRHIPESSTKKLESIFIEKTLKPTSKIALGYSSKVVLGYSEEEAQTPDLSLRAVNETVVDGIRENDSYIFEAGYDYRVFFSFSNTNIDNGNEDGGDGDNQGGNNGNENSGNQSSSGDSSKSSGNKGKQANEKADKSSSLPIVLNTANAKPVVNTDIDVMSEEEKRKGLTLPKTGGTDPVSFRVPIMLLLSIAIINLPSLIKRWFKKID